MRSFCYNYLVQKQPKSKLYKKLFIGSACLFILGLLVTFTGLFNLYGSVNKCGFGAGNCSYSNTHGVMAQVGSIAVAIGFYTGLVFIILFLAARHKEKKP